MKDFKGNELKEGNRVIGANALGFLDVGTIVRINDKNNNITIEMDNNKKRVISCASHRTILVPDDFAL